MTSEREGDTWASLIASPLTPLQIVRAKMLGAFWAGRWVGAVWLSLLLTGACLAAVHPVGLLAHTAVIAVYLWFACALGMFYSLRCRNSTRSLVATVATLIVCNGLYLLPLIPFRLHGTIWGLGAGPYISFGSLMSFIDVHVIMNNEPEWYSDFGNYDYIFTYAASLAVYATAALALTYYLVAGFDDAIDRPRTEGGRQPKVYFPRGVARMRNQKGLPDGETA